MNIRNIAIIAHVDHGKTTLVDGFLKQSKTFRDNETEMSEVLIMDSSAQEKERGITILAKNTAIKYQDTKINIIDTPGHSDFGGEVERTLNMAEGAILLIDAKEGPMPQTKFVLKKALEMGLKIIVVINKIDKLNADIPATINQTYDLFLELAKKDSDLDFPIYFSIGREGKVWGKLPSDKNQKADLTPIFDAIIKYIPAPEKNDNAPLKILVSALDRDNFMGKYAIGKISSGIAQTGMSVSAVNQSGIIETGKIEKILIMAGLKKSAVPDAHSGDIVAIAGLKNVSIGDTIADVENPMALPSIAIEEPTLSISVYANTSPLAGKEGKFVTARQLGERIQKELETNVSMKLESAPNGEFVLYGRGELHLSVFIENLRREGYELQVGKPKVVTKEIDEKIYEPIEELTIDVAPEYANSIIGEVNRRRGIFLGQKENSDSSVRLTFEISTRGTLGLRNVLLTVSKGTATMNTLFLRFDQAGSIIPKTRNGALVAFKNGKAVAYGLNIAQQRGAIFIPPATLIYEGMIVGLHSRENDIEVNVAKEKQLTNMRASGSDASIILTPPTIMSLEQCIDFLEDDELLEVTPKNLRLRKKILDNQKRIKAKKHSGL